MSWLSTIFSICLGAEARTLTGSEYLFTQGELMAPSCKLSNSTECSLELDYCDLVTIQIILHIFSI